MRRAIFVLLLLMPFLAARAEEDLPVRDRLTAFKRLFGPGMNARTRQKAIDDLAAVPSKLAADSFLHGLRVTVDRVRKLLVEREETREELKRLEKQLVEIQQRAVDQARREGRPPPRQIPVPATLAQAQRVAREKVERLQKEIDEEYELRKRLAEGMGAWITDLPDGDRATVLKDIERKGFRDRDWMVRALHARALGKTERPEATRLLMIRLAEESDPRVLPLVVEAAAEQAKETALPDLLRLLEDRRWQIRVAVVAALGRLRSPEAVGPLIEALRAESGRLRGDIAAALKAITGKDLGISADRWKTWWDEHGDSFEPPSPDAAGGDGPEGESLGGKPPGEVPPDVPSFYGIRIVSKSVLFVIDVSGSMNDPVSPKDPERTKIAVAKYELKNALLALPDDARFNIVFYNFEVHQWRKGMVKAGKREKRAAIQFVEAMGAEGATNIHDALRLAFHVVGMGSRDRNYELGADTIIFLSDGRPTVGDVLDPAQILAAVKRWNELRRVKIHTVGVGGDHDAGFMNDLAMSSGGTYVSR